MAKNRPQTIESATADAVLERVKAITIGGVEYIVAPPTLATLILVSEEVSYLPNLDIREDNILEDTLRVARYYHGLADIAAILILGAQRLEVEEIVTKRVLGLFPRTRKVKVNMKQRIAEAMLNVEIKELSNAVGQMLSMLQTNMPRSCVSKEQTSSLQFLILDTAAAAQNITMIPASRPGQDTST